VSAARLAVEVLTGPPPGAEADPAVDLDLHVTTGDAALFATPGDASWCHPRDPGPERLDRGDDVALLADARGAPGLERAGSSDPQSGEMTVWVHDLGHAGGPRAAWPVAEVRVYIDGVQVKRAERPVGRGRVWEVGTVSWPEGAWAPAEGPLVEARRSTCG
jgi:hypothetical protein